MIFPLNRMRVVVATKTVDFRKGHARLTATEETPRMCMLGVRFMSSYFEERGADLRDVLRLRFGDDCEPFLGLSLIICGAVCRTYSRI